MSTDATHIHSMLDRMRETQHQHGVLLQDLSEGQEEGRRIMSTILSLLRERAAPVKRKLPSGSVATGVQYLVALGAVIVMLKGGDLSKLAPLLKLLGLP